MEVDPVTRRQRSPDSGKDDLPRKRVHIASPLTASNPKKKGKLSKKQKRKLFAPESGSPDDVIWRDVRQLLGEAVVDEAVENEKDLLSPVQFGDELELVVAELSSNGECLAQLPSPFPPWVIVVPFALPEERIRVKVTRNARMHSHADLLDIIEPNKAMRDMSRVQCKYFQKCSGCQYQMLDYSMQIDLKRRVVDKAYQYFSLLDPSLIPAALPTIGSPKQYAYRTKITPHFDAPPKSNKEWEPWIGFDEKGRRKVLDIEECPIATQVLNTALGPIRKEVKENIYSYKRGSTLLLRDSIAKVETESSLDLPIVDGHVCIRDHKAIVREKVGDKIFEFPAGSFFQNNNSILVPLTEYVRDAALSSHHLERRPTHLVDAYCGSGLFAITLSSNFDHVAGIEISEDSIRYARHNVALNGIDRDKCTFRAGQAEKIFEVVGDFPPLQTVMVIDPPRKGCDDKFIEQLLEFGAGTVVYVSCNVHTQARDVGNIVTGSSGKSWSYTLESLRGFDLFPQTAHVESVAILRRTSVSK